MVLTKAYRPATDTSRVRDVTVGDLLRAAVRKAPSDRALSGGSDGDGRSWTYAELLDEATRGAALLLESVRQGDRLAVCADSTPEAVIVHLAAALAGVVVVPIDPGLSPAEATSILERAGTRVMVYSETHRGRSVQGRIDGLRASIRDLRRSWSLGQWRDCLERRTPTEGLPVVSPSQIAYLLYTSGTTGSPRGVLLRHHAIVNNAALVVDGLAMRPGGAWVNPLPLFHTGGCVVGALGSVALTAEHIVVPRFDAESVLTLLESSGASVLVTVPTMLSSLTAHPRFGATPLPSLRVVIVGGARVPPPLVRAVEEALGVRVVILYGQTELSPVLSMTTPQDVLEDRMATVGRPLPGVECKVAGIDSADAAPLGELGEICARGYQVMAGYDRDEVTTAEVLDASGWLRTGDLGSMDERGYLTITGRVRETIIRGGVNIDPAEIEAVIALEPSVGACAVVGVPDAHYGEIVAVVIIPREPDGAVDVAGLRHRCAESLARHKHPRLWFTAAELPLTGTGKLRRADLREAIEKGKLRVLSAVDLGVVASA